MRLSQDNASVGIALEVEPQAKPWRATPRDDTPFRILILADLSGRPAQRPALARGPVQVDRDNLDEVMAQFSPRLDLAGASIVFRELEDFHPDRLLARVPLFARLRELRRQLNDPRAFEAAARELLGEEAPASSPPAAPPPLPPSGSLLDAMVEAVAGPAPPDAPQPARPRDEFQEEIRRIMTPHLLPRDDPRRGALEMRLDAATGALMQSLLHDPAYQALEGAWRAIDLFVRRTDTGADLGIWLLDVTRAELAADLYAAAAPERSALHRRLVDEAVGLHGGVAWSLIVGDYTFGPGDDDVRLLAALAAVAKRAHAPFIAAGAPALCGAPGFAQPPEPADWGAPGSAAFDAFRRSEDARWTGLALPRFLLRLPYGKSGEPCDSFAFEELATTPAHEDYLWGRASWACGMLIAESFAEAGWGFRPGMQQNLGNLPLHIRHEGGVAVAQPCAESVMTERAAQRMLECGLIPLASLRDSGAVRVVRFQSVASPLAALAGRWHSGPH